MNKELYLTQSDKSDLLEKIAEVKSALTRSVYIAGLIQFIAIITSVLAIVNYMLK